MTATHAGVGTKGKGLSHLPFVDKAGRESREILVYSGCGKQNRTLLASGRDVLEVEVPEVQYSREAKVFELFWRGTIVYSRRLVFSVSPALYIREQGSGLAVLCSTMSNLTNEERRRDATQLKARVKTLTSPITYLSHSRVSALHAQTAPVVLIDVREHEENVLSTIPSAIHSSQAVQHIERLQGKEFNVVCFCTVGFRSGLFAKSLVPKVGNVFNYSIMEHVWGGGTLVSPQGEQQDRVHVYHRNYINVFPDTYNMEVFGNMKALMRGIGHLPRIISAISSRSRTSQAEEEPIGS